jgi:nucleotide-binding universal stress UspA family protein
VIVTAVAELGADLLAVGPRGRGRLAGLALGSVTHALLGRAPCPILVGRRPVAAPRKVVLGVDGSGNGREAARHLAEYPLAAGALVIVASVAPAGPSSSQSDAAARRAALAHATAAAAVVAAAGHATDVVVPAGKPAEEIIELARAADADLVAVGSRGHGAVRGFLLGSVSRHVVTGAPCSVLVAPPPRAGSPAAQGT